MFLQCICEHFFYDFFTVLSENKQMFELLVWVTETPIIFYRNVASVYQRKKMEQSFGSFLVATISTLHV